MFVVLIKDVDGRRWCRYFRKWKNAEAAMMRGHCRGEETDGNCFRVPS